MREWEIIEKDLFAMWNCFYIEYASPFADEPVCNLSMLEVEKILTDIIFSKNTVYDNCVKLIVKLHCLGINDTKIAKGLEMLGQKIEVNTITQIRFKALRRIEEVVGKDIGLITILYETFHEVN